MISPKNGYSSCSLLMCVADKIKIQNIHIATFRVGKKELNELINIKKLHDCEIFIASSDLQKQINTGIYQYDEFFESTCNLYNIKYKYVKNHSKVIMLLCENDYYVIETSSNFNENPKIEQFSLTNSKELYDFYLKNYKKLDIFD